MNIPADTTPVVELLKTHLMSAAQPRTIRRAVAGSRFCAVMLDDGTVGAANVCAAVCGQASPHLSDSLPPPGTPAGDVLASLGPPANSPLGLATANALANRPRHEGGGRSELDIGGDVLEHLDLRHDDHLAMIGRFCPLEDAIRDRVGHLAIFEREPRLAEGLLPERRIPDVLPDCSVALVTATTLINGAIDAILAAAVNCREVVLLGPSTPLVPEVFTRPPCRVTLLSGMLITAPEELLSTVARGGGTRDFHGTAVKVNVRV